MDLMDSAAERRGEGNSYVSVKHGIFKVLYLVGGVC